ncbi:hypothetical protein MHYP_G00308900 [Metynnis hypsauchen]
MRQISKSWKTTDVPGQKVISKTLPMWKAQTPMVAFFRIGTICSSKSQLMNRLINEKHDTFFHRNCPGSSRDRLLMDGVVEIAWYCPSGKSTDHFSDCVAFCNLHGDSSTNVTQIQILTEMASVNVVLLPNLDENDNNMVILQNLFESSTPLIVVLTDEEDDDEDTVCEIGDSKYKLALKGRNQSEVSVALREAIKNCIIQQPVTFELENIAKYDKVKLDEKNETCERGKEAALQIRRFLQTEDPSTVKDKYLPCQGKLWHISNKLYAATFGLEHMLREMSQIYEASVQKMQQTEDGDLSYVPRLAAHLMISGHPMELMDGDAAHVPLVWVSAVLDEVVNKLKNQRIFVLSILGIQSSGKSTMLNAMFGLQFAVSAGRCTRGAFMQLVKVSEEKKKELKFDYILVVDTEGLRALELAGKKSTHHDNELATFVVGLGNMTLINIFGENPSEMQDILQIVVQAFMRMKKVKLNPSCMFVHQNVTDIAAGDKIMEGRRRLQDKMDEMTKLAAKDEVYDAESFSDVIAFDVQNDVKYFSQLWEGSPPMAPPNPSYSENIQELKQAILSRASKTHGMKLSQFQMRVKDLWNALLNENFVFSFRNTVEISAYRKLEEEYEKWTWSLRSAMLSIEDKMLNRIASGKMKTVDMQELVKEMAVTLEDVQKAFKAYFEENSEKETLIQWKRRFETKIQNLHDDLVNETKRKLDNNIQQKNLRKKLDQQLMNYEKTLFEKSKELAMKLKENGDKSRDPKAEFDSVWEKWVSQLAKDAAKIKDADIENDVINILEDFYKSSVDVRNRKESQEYRRIDVSADYKNYVSVKKKFWETFILWGKSLQPEDQNSIQDLISKVIQQTTEKANSFPVSVQGYSATYIQDIIRDVKQIVTEFKSKSDSFEFKKKFFVDLSLYVCEQAEVRFAELHRKYKELNDPLIYFEKKRDEYYKVFENYFKGATSAAVIADQICSKLKETILQSVYSMTATFICGQMRGKLPFNGNRADLEKCFLKSLAEQEGRKDEKFENFLTYLKQPKTHFKNFITQKVKEYMAAENPEAVYAIKEHIEHKQRIVISKAEMARDEVKCRNGDVKMWLEVFSSSLADELGDTRVHLCDEVSEDVTDYDVLVDFIKEELCTVVEELKRSPSKLSDFKMWMFRERPDEILIKHFCSCCWEQCPFCGAVCTNSQENHTGDHHTDFHRSTGLTGWHRSGTEELCIDFCTTKVVSDRCFHPSHDPEKSVPYKVYRTAGGEYANWSISADLSNLAYWQWFVCEFQENIENHYKKYFNGQEEIPAGWRRSTQSDAVESLGINQ